MFVPTLVMGALAVILVFLAYRQGKDLHVEGFKRSVVMLKEILPLLFLAFVVAGMVQVLIPKEQIAKWIGDESGMKGILIGSIVGGFAPGGPYVSLPIVAGLLKTGASVGTMVAFLTGWSLLAFGRLPMELGILGWKFTLVRLVSVCIFPPIAGWIAQTFFAGVK